MKKAFRAKASSRGQSLEKEFSDFEVMAPAEEGKRSPRKPARATIASADTRGQRAAATRARKTATSTGSKARRSTPRSAAQKKQGVTQGSKKARSARSRSVQSR